MAFTCVTERRIVIAAPGRSEGPSPPWACRRVGHPPNLNTLGWKVAHLEPVGFRTSTRIEDLEIDLLADRHRRLLRPRNMFLIPMSHGGLAEVAEFIEAFPR